MGMSSVLPIYEGYFEVDIRNLDCIVAKRLINYVKSCIKQQGR